jgi:hypothetical protein
MAAQEAFLGGGSRSAGWRWWFYSVAELDVGHGGSRRPRSESARVSALAVREGGARTRRRVVAVGSLLLRRWGPADILGH